MRSSTVDAPQQRVWDLPVRLFHWLIVLLLGLLWYTGDVGGLDISLPLPGGKTLFLANMDLHMLAGQTVLALVLFRVLWGVAGSTTARFAAFVRGPKAALAYLKATLRGDAPVTFGHNPAGGLMIVLMLGLLLAQGVTGLFASDDLFSEGPLAHLVGSDVSGRLTELHGWLFKALLAAAAVHVAVILTYLLRGKNLVRAMVTGRAPHVPNPANGAAVRWAPTWLAAVLLALAGLAVWSLRWL